LAAWVRNNWRPATTVAASKALIRVTAIDIVWQEHREAVVDVMRENLGVTDLDSTSLEYFKQRVPAIKQVLDKMTEREQAHVHMLVEKHKAEGNIPSVQRQ